MKIALLLDHDLEGYRGYLAAGWRASTWDELIQLEFKRLRDYGLPEDLPDQAIRRFAQAHQLLLTATQKQ